ncbi:MAG TPA: SDR family oxidoreductase [Trebonia sp.]|nr:SDR family oxidoreductase [Trebonia sp.]
MSTFTYGRAFALSRAMARPLIAHGRPGSVLYTGSVTGARAGLRDAAPYGAAKSGLLGLMRTLAVEWARPRGAGEHGGGRLRRHRDDAGY